MMEHCQVLLTCHCVTLWPCHLEATGPLKGVLPAASAHDQAGCAPSATCRAWTACALAGLLLALPAGLPAASSPSPIMGCTLAASTGGREAEMASWAVGDWGGSPMARLGCRALSTWDCCTDMWRASNSWRSRVRRAPSTKAGPWSMVSV